MRGKHDLDQFGGRLAAALEQTGKDRRGLAQALKVSEQAIGQVLSGETKSMTAYNAVKAARYLEIDCFWLATGEGEMIPSREDDLVFRLSELVDDIADLPESHRTEAINAAVVAVGRIKTKARGGSGAKGGSGGATPSPARHRDRDTPTTDGHETKPRHT